MTELKVVVLCFPYFIDNCNIDYILISLKILNGLVKNYDDSLKFVTTTYHNLGAISRI